MRVEDYWRIFRHGWYIVLIAAIIGGLLGYGYSLLQPKVYTATAQSFVAISSTSSVNDNIVSGAQFIQQRVNSYSQLISSPEVLDPVIAELGLPETSQELSKQVTASSPPLTVLINVTAMYGNAELAAKIANAAAVQLGKSVVALETPEGATASPVKVKLTDPAIAPKAQSSPKTINNTALGLLIGLLLGLGWLLLRNALDTSVKQQEDVEEMTGATPLALMGDDPSAKSKPLVALDQKAPRSEAFRSLRTNLQFVDVDNPPKVIAITSSLPDEGKSTTSCNLAITMGQTGLRVCLVDTDLRHSSVATYLGIEGSVGLTNVLAGQITLADALVPWGRGLLTVLPSGPMPPNPSELLGSHNFSAVLSALRDSFDVIILDACPLLPVTDGAIASAAADGALLVVRHGKTRKEQLRRALDSLSQVDARVLGTVVNFVPTKRRAHGYGYGYGYGYTYWNGPTKPHDRRKRKSNQKPELPLPNPQHVIVPAPEG